MLPDADAMILPFDAVGVDVGVVEPVTTMVTPAQGFEGGGGVELPLLQLTSKMIMHKEDAVIKVNIFFINSSLNENAIFLKKVALILLLKRKIFKPHM